ncbi:Uu.00g037550.m01.CDS01 [Anthostomella pinea]|uniref:Uu.00g037550.m01.CDS01 n=1 Tax=Anthostomella pinea TaxID=933095 RepID=A0AAI8VA56_9PEZI|nr:Uu.00g037550.m01.CDS01 [Anthostomella pinea]
MTMLDVSHGRGGAGNITPDNTQYVDGEILRQGTPGSHGDGAFSTGRGGAANIADADKPPAPMRADEEVIPQEATRPSAEGDFHTGRGGAANVHLGPEHQKHSKVTDAAQPSATTHGKQGLADKLKNKMMGVFKK